jgi:hypothetical protein
MRWRPAPAIVVVLTVFLGCAMARHRQQVREGFLTRGLHREAFLKEWGQPDRTFTQPADETIFRAEPFGPAGWVRPVYEVWQYQSRATCLVFDGVRLIQWQTGRTDCTPRPRKAEGAAPRRTPQPYPPYPD